MNVTFRPIEKWPRAGFEQGRRRERSRFDTPYSAQMELLKYELGRIGARAVVIRLALEDKDIRRDGFPRSMSRPAHPGVIVEWQDSRGWLRRSNDKYDNWQDCMFAIAKTLEALRGVERWESVEHGEQYEGFRLELEGGESGEISTVEQARRFFIEQIGGREDLELHDAYNVNLAYRQLSKKLHPDVKDTGDAEAFKKLQRARDLLLGGAS